MASTSVHANPVNDIVLTKVGDRVRITRRGGDIYRVCVAPEEEHATAHEGYPCHVIFHEHSEARDGGYLNIHLKKGKYPDLTTHIVKGILKRMPKGETLITGVKDFATELSWGTRINKHTVFLRSDTGEEMNRKDVPSSFHGIYYIVLDTLKKKDASSRSWYLDTPVDTVIVYMRKKCIVDGRWFTR